MKRALIFILFVLISMTWSMGILRAEEKKMGLKPMSRDQLIRLALSAAPPDIAKDAAVMIPGKDGNLVEVKKGTNGFTCIPDADGESIPNPICMNAAATQWLKDLMSGVPQPTNTDHGISYRARGGWHFEKDGKIVMKKEPGVKMVQDPPHWMIMWPYWMVELIDAKTGGMPTGPNPDGIYIKFESTPYAHMVVYEDFTKLK